MIFAISKRGLLFRFGLHGYSLPSLLRSCQGSFRIAVLFGGENALSRLHISPDSVILTGMAACPFSASRSPERKSPVRGAFAVSKNAPPHSEGNLSVFHWQD